MMMMYLNECGFFHTKIVEILLKLLFVLLIAMPHYDFKYCKRMVWYDKIENSNFLSLICTLFRISYRIFFDEILFVAYLFVHSGE